MSKFTVRWGILATGGIAETFTRDLLCPPETRGVKDIVHTVAAAASSSSADRAKEFLKTVGAPSSARAYGSYRDLAADPDVDIIYVATPHSHHYQNARLCLEAGKNVLCEKAFTTNAAQARILVGLARKKNLFLMEAVWTRYFPLSIYVRDVITSGQIGTVYRVEADNSPGFVDPAKAFPDTSRMVNPDLAGGALLDLGIYSLTWLFQCLYTTQPPDSRAPPKVLGAITKYAKTGVDEATSMLLTFPRRDGTGDAHGIATTSMRTSSDPDRKGTAGPAVRVYGDKGEVQVWFPTYRPERTRLIRTGAEDGGGGGGTVVEDKHWPQPGPGKGSGWRNGFLGRDNGEGVGHGMFWEADECAYALREGRKEGRFEGWEESVAVMEVMDEVRRQNGLRYPDKVETTDYPVDL